MPALRVWAPRDWAACPVRGPQVVMSVAVNKPRAGAEWTARGETGSMATLRIAVWLARRLGRPFARILLLPVCLGFAVCRPDARAASKHYLARALGRPAHAGDVLRHFFAFATT